MKRKIVTVIVAAMMITCVTACGQTADSASAKESVPDTEEAVVVDTETEELEKEEPTELAESIEEIEETEVTESTEEEQVEVAENKVQNDKNSTASKATNNAATESNSTASITNSSPTTTTSETPTTSTPAPADTTATATTPDTTTTAHEHVWVEHLATGHYEEQVVTEAYDEPVYEYQDVCNKCGTVLPDEEAIAIHYGFYCDGSYSNVKVQTGTIHHEAITQTVWVEDAAGWYDCSICGERSAMASHNHN